jgi:hypothetical protein
MMAQTQKCALSASALLPLSRSQSLPSAVDHESSEAQAAELQKTLIVIADRPGDGAGMG